LQNADKVTKSLDLHLGHFADIIEGHEMFIFIHSMGWAMYGLFIWG